MARDIEAHTVSQESTGISHWLGESHWLNEYESRVSGWFDQLASEQARLIQQVPLVHSDPTGRPITRHLDRR
jgi:hypothetical protein